MTRRPALLAVSLVLGATLLPSLVGMPVRASMPPPAPVTAATPVAESATAARPTTPASVSATTGDIVPGSVDRSSLFLDATYDAYLKVSWGARLIWVDSTATIRNTSGAAIDRIELNTIAARLGSIQLQSVTVDGVAVAATRSDQTIVAPLGGILPVDATTQIRVRFHAILRSSLSGSNWLFTKTNGIIDLYRWLP